MEISDNNIKCLITDYNTPEVILGIKELLLLTEHYINDTQKNNGVNKYLLGEIMNYVKDLLQDLGFIINKESENKEYNEEIIKKFLDLRSNIKTHSKESLDKSYLFNICDNIRTIVLILLYFI